MTPRDSIVGALLGGAIGDGLGAQFEGQNPPIDLDPDAVLRISDETQLTLATCRAIVAAGRPDPERIAAEFAGCFRQGSVRGLGASTLKALRELAVGGHWALVGRKGEMAAGNGAAMRVAPLAFLLEPADPESRQIVRDISRITHHHEEAYCGALAIVIAVRQAFTASWRGGTGLLSTVASQLPDSAVRDRLHELAATCGGATLAEAGRRFGTSGYVVESVPLAMLAAERVRALGLSTVLEEIVTLGGDTDTIASMAGQISGASIGHEGLPQDLLARLEDRGPVLQTATEFADYVVRN